MPGDGAGWMVTMVPGDGDAGDGAGGMVPGDGAGDGCRSEMSNSSAFYQEANISQDL